MLVLLPAVAFGCAATATNDTPSEGGAGATSTAGTAGARAGASGALSSSGAPSTGGGGASAGAGAGTAGSSAGKGGASPGGSGSPGTGGGKCSTSGPNGEVFFDGFEDGELVSCPKWVDADPSLGGMWSVKTDGASKVLAQSAAVSDWVIAVSGDYKVTDQTVQAKVKLGAEGEIGIFARVQDLRNYYFLYLDGSNIVLRGRVDNSQLTSVKVKTVTVPGTWYTLKLSVVGSTLTGYLDGTMLVTSSDASVKSGGIGVGTGDSASGEFDDVTVTTP